LTQQASVARFKLVVDCILKGVAGARRADAVRRNCAVVGHVLSCLAETSGITGRDGVVVCILKGVVYACSAHAISLKAAVVRHSLATLAKCASDARSDDMVFSILVRITRTWDTFTI
jgi:hypothetical protein